MAVRKNLVVNGSSLTDTTCDSMTRIEDMRLFSTVYPSLLCRYMAQVEMVFKIKKTDAIDVLDAGCGNGAAIQLWASNNFSCINRQVGICYTGVDMFREAIAAAKKHNLEGKAYIQKCDFLHHDLSEPWIFAQDSSFDVIWYTEVIEHLPKDKAQFSLHESYRVLRPQGSMIISTPAPFGESLVWPEAHLHEFSREAMRNMLETAGFIIDDVWGVGVNWTKARKHLRQLNPLKFKILEDLRKRISGPFARVAVQALAPEVCDDLAWKVHKP